VLLIGKGVIANFKSTVAYDHYSLLRTVGSALGLTTLTSNDAAAAPLSDFFAPIVPPTPTPTPTPTPMPTPTPADGRHSAASSPAAQPVDRTASQSNQPSPAPPKAAGAPAASPPLPQALTAEPDFVALWLISRSGRM
jgi:hypothetical protein